MNLDAVVVGVTATILFAMAGVPVYAHCTAQTPADVIVSSPGETDTAYRPAIFVTCRAGFESEAIPTGTSLVIRCTKSGGQ